MDFQNQKISVIGAARSGIAAATVLKRLGAQVLLADSQCVEKLAGERITEINGLGVRFAPEASLNEALPEGTDLVVTSPGVPQNAPILQAALARGIPIWSEIELAYRLTATPIIAITGTNGKTTTTILIADMLEQGGFKAIVAGNVSADEIKKTLVDAASETLGREDNKTLLIAEISSFQLEWVEKFAPRVGVLTNITPDHLNRHTSFDAYAQTKARLFAAQTESDWAVLNYDDPIVRDLGELGLRGRRVWISLQEEIPTPPCAYIAQGALTVQLAEAPVRLFPIAEMPGSMPGKHSLFNALAAASVACILEVEAPAIRRALQQFRGVAHRMELVAKIHGVSYINNSMCTNVAAMIASLSALESPAIVIAGGADKGLDFTPLIPTLQQHARKVILIGSAAETMAVTFQAGGYHRLQRAETLEAAVAFAHGVAQPGEVVILSPGCASFDMFRDFEARGAAFRNAVLAIQQSCSVTKETA